MREGIDASKGNSQRFLSSPPAVCSGAHLLICIFLAPTAMNWDYQHERFTVYHQSGSEKL